MGNRQFSAPPAVNLMRFTTFKNKPILSGKNDLSFKNKQIGTKVKVVSPRRHLYLVNEIEDIK